MTPPAPPVRTARRDPLDPVEIRTRVQACPDVVRLVGRSGAARTADLGGEEAGTGDPGTDDPDTGDQDTGDQDTSDHAAGDLADGDRTGAGAVGGVEVVSYASGRRVEGVRVRPGAVTVRVVCRFGPTVAELAAQVRAAVLATARGPLRVDVIIDDLEVDAPAWAGVRTDAGQGAGNGR